MGLKIVEELAASLGIDVDGAAFEKAHAILQGVTGGLLGIGAALGAYAAGIAAVMSSTANAASAARRSAQETGTTTDAIQELHFAAEASGMSADSLDHALMRLSRTAYEASHGSAEARRTLWQLGVSAYDSTGQLRTTDDMLLQMSRRFSTMPDGMRKTAMAQKVFGRSGAELIPFLNKGAEGIDELRVKAREYGVVLDTDTIAAAKEWKLANHELEASLTGLKYEIGGPLLKGVGELAKAIAGWVAAHRKMIGSVIRKPYELMRDGIKWVVANLWVLKSALVVAVSYLLVTYIPAIVAGVAAIWAWVASLGAFEVASMLAAAASAAGAVLATLAWTVAIAALILILQDFWVFVSGSGESAIGNLNKMLEDWFKNPAFDPKKGWLGDLLSFFQTILYTVTHVGETLDNWKELLAGKTGVGSYAKAMISDMFGGPPRPEQIAAMGGGGPMGPAGPGAQPVGPMAPASQQSVRASIGTINVHPPPGGSPAAYAQATTDALDDWFNGVTQQSIPAVQANR
jgi:hypothetical protein